MGAIPFAISVHHFVSTVGADAGFGAIIGLAILILLFFSQARETSSLRHRAEESEEHVRELELAVARLSRTGSPAQPPQPAVAPAPPSVQRTIAPTSAAVGAAAVGAAGAAAAGAVAAGAAVASKTVRPAAAGIPAAPAGVGAPALSSATRLIPTGGEDPISIHATGAQSATGVGAAPTDSAAESGAAVLAPSGPPPSTAAAGANGGASRVPPPVGAAAAGATAAGRSPQQGQRGARPTSPRPPQPPTRRPAPAQRPSRARGAALIAGGVIAFAAIVVALLVLTSGGTSSSHSSSASQTSNAGSAKHHRGGHGAAALKPPAVMVDVLNGTSTTNLAHDITQRLANAGYKTGTPATATDQTQTATSVGFTRGHRAAALLVAKSLDLGKGAVGPVAQANEAVACPQSSSCTAQVIVTVGADLASSAATTTSAVTT